VRHFVVVHRRGIDFTVKDKPIAEDFAMTPSIEALSSGSVMATLDIRSPESFWRLRTSDPSFPAPFQYRPGGKNFWLKCDVNAWLVARAASAAPRGLPHPRLRSTGRPRGRQVATHATTTTKQRRRRR
jgi:hypothetical protein